MPHFIHNRRGAALRPHPRLDFAAINRAALPHLESLCQRWLPAGQRIGQAEAARKLASMFGLDREGRRYD